MNAIHLQIEIVERDAVCLLDRMQHDKDGNVVGELPQNAIDEWLAAVEGKSFLEMVLVDVQGGNRKGFRSHIFAPVNQQYELTQLMKTALKLVERYYKHDSPSAPARPVALFS